MASDPRASGDGGSQAPPSCSTTYADWYAHHWNPTRKLATRLLGDAAAAEDVAAEVLCRVWARWQNAGVPRWPTAYLNQATRNAVASMIRRDVRDRRMLERLVSDQQEADPADSFGERAAVADLLDRLPAAEREAVVLFYLEDLSADEIAAPRHPTGECPQPPVS